MVRLGVLILSVEWWCRRRGGWKPAFFDGDLDALWICNFEVMDARLGSVDKQDSSCLAGEV